MSVEFKGAPTSRKCHQFAPAALVAAAMALATGCGGMADDPPASQVLAAAPSLSASVKPQHPQAAAPSLGEPIDTALAEQVAVLRREVADLRIQVAHLPGAGRVDATQPPVGGGPETVAEAEQADRMRLAASETAFRNEPEDFPWSRGAVESVRGIFMQGDAAQRDELRNVECRSRSCRVELGTDHARGGAGDLPGRVLQLAAAFPNVAAGQLDAGDGRKVTVLYLSR